MYKRLVAPISAQVEICTACNNACTHCYNYWRHEQESEDISLDPIQISKILTTLAAQEVLEVVITGGEPLLNKVTLHAAVAKATALGFGVSMNSNLRNLTKEDARLLKHSGLRSILTSVLGPDAETHDAITHRPGSFADTVRGINVAQAEGISVSASFVISPSNIDTVQETIRFLHSLGVAAVHPTKASCPENCRDKSSIVLDAERVNKFVDDLESVEQEVQVAINALSSYPLCGVDNPRYFDRPCMAGVATCAIGADGTVRPCNHNAESYGNIFTDRFSDIWARMDEWTDSSLLPKECKTCVALLYCGGGCRMEAKTLNGSKKALDFYARPNKAQELFATIKASHQRKSYNAPKYDTFTVGNIRLRKENFGGVITLRGGGKTVLLDEHGYNVALQLEQNKRQAVAAINWEQVDPYRFLASLESRGLIHQ